MSKGEGGEQMFLGAYSKDTNEIAFYVDNGEIHIPYNNYRIVYKENKYSEDIIIDNTRYYKLNSIRIKTTLLRWRVFRNGLFDKFIKLFKRYI